MYIYLTHDPAARGDIGEISSYCILHTQDIPQIHVYYLDYITVLYYYIIPGYPYDIITITF